MRQRRQTLHIIFVVIIIFVFICGGCKKTEVPLEQVDAVVTEPIEESVEFIYVHVCGAVKKPGVYELAAGSRVTHAIDAAGGLTNDADEDYLNQAAALEDGQKVYIPNQKESQTIEQSDGRVNINTAEKAQLMELSGIGESRAQAIILYREKNGGFKSIEEIKKIDGIKERIFEEIKNQIKVE